MVAGASRSAVPGWLHRYQHFVCTQTLRGAASAFGAALQNVKDKALGLSLTLCGAASQNVKMWAIMGGIVTFIVLFIVMAACGVQFQHC